MKIKVCGLICEEDASYINENDIDYAGVVMFYPKSKRNVTMEKAKSIINAVDKAKMVAVVVSPTIEQVLDIQAVGFDYIQIHGDMPEGIIRDTHIPIFKAFNISDMDRYEEYSKCDRIKAYVFDAQEPGSGKTFSWDMVKDMPRDDKMFILAGGLSIENVAEAIKYLKPDGVDISTGVEYDDGTLGKNPDKIRLFAKEVRGCQNF